VIRLAYIVSHPIQYQAPLLRRLALEPKLDLTVLFLSDFSTRQYLDPGFGQSISWDVNLLDGYKSKILRAWGSRDRLGFWRPYTVGIEREMRRGEYDAVWLHGYAHHAQLRALVAAKSLGTKVLLRGESHDKSSDRSPILSALKRQILEALFRQVDAFLAIGTANRDYYLGHGVAAEKIFMMPYAVDNVSFQASATRTSRLELLSELRLRPDRPVILFASKLQARKRPGDLWDAYTRLSSNGVDEPWPYLIFAGEGEQRSELEAAVAKRGWDSVRIVGFQNQTKIPAYYAAADVFVLPSEREPWGLVVNEAMNAGKAMIVSDQVGAGADLVQDGVNGYVVPVGDLDALATRLRQITSNPALAASMGASSLRNISRWDFEADVAGLHKALVGCGVGATNG
jgi:glycosyltransferase involved in cell wall biosynthesis